VRLLAIHPSSFVSQVMCARLCTGSCTLAAYAACCMHTHAHHKHYCATFCFNCSCATSAGEHSNSQLHKLCPSSHRQQVAMPALPSTPRSLGCMPLTPCLSSLDTCAALIQTLLASGPYSLHSMRPLSTETNPAGRTRRTHFGTRQQQGLGTPHCLHRARCRCEQ
jgi:hypothetical protein